MSFRVLHRALPDLQQMKHWFYVTMRAVWWSWYYVTVRAVPWSLFLSSCPPGSARPAADEGLVKCYHITRRRGVCFLLANSFFELQIPCSAAGIPGSLREQGIHGKALILLCDQARGPPKTGKFGRVFVKFPKFPAKFPASRESRPAKARLSAPAVASLKALKEASLTNPECLPAGLFHVKQSTNIAHGHHHPPSGSLPHRSDTGIPPRTSTNAEKRDYFSKDAPDACRHRRIATGSGRCNRPCGRYSPRLLAGCILAA